MAKLRTTLEQLSLDDAVDGAGVAEEGTELLFRCPTKNQLREGRDLYKQLQMHGLRKQTTDVSVVMK